MGFKKWPRKRRETRYVWKYSGNCLYISFVYNLATSLPNDIYPGTWTRGHRPPEKEYTITINFVNAPLKRDLLSRNLPRVDAHEFYD